MKPAEYWIGREPSTDDRTNWQTYVAAIQADAYRAGAEAMRALLSDFLEAHPYEEITSKLLCDFYGIPIPTPSARLSAEDA